MPRPLRWRLPVAADCAEVVEGPGERHILSGFYMTLVPMGVADQVVALLIDL